MYSTQGIVLKKYPAGEAGALFNIYTENYGKITALAQGVKKEEAKLKGHLEPLNLASIGFVLGKRGERLIQANVINQWPNIRRDFRKISAAYYFAELVDKNCLPGQQDEPLWKVLFSFLKRLEEATTAEKEILSKMSREFEMEFLRCLGYEGEKDFRVLSSGVVKMF